MPTSERAGEGVQTWATREGGSLTPRHSREDAEKWAAMGRDRGREAVLIEAPADLQARIAEAMYDAYSGGRADQWLMWSAVPRETRDYWFNEASIYVTSPREQTQP